MWEGGSKSDLHGSISTWLLPRSSVSSTVEVDSMRERPCASSFVAPTLLPTSSSILSLAFRSQMSQRAISPTSLSLEPEPLKFHAGLFAARRVPRRPAAMRHVLFMKGLLRNAAADSSVSHPSHPSSACMSRCCAKRPSWKERCLNWYCAGATSVCASRVFVSGKPASSLFRCSHRVMPSGFT